MKSFFDVRHPFFRPAWRRAALTGFTLVWALVELANNAPGWAVMFGAISAYLFWCFFIAFDPKDYEGTDGN